MRITERILGFTLLGSEWVLWVLIGLSLLSVTIMVERGIYLAAGRTNFEDLAKQLLAFLKDNDAVGARRVLEGQRAPESQIALAGLEQHARGSEAISEAMASTKSRLRIDMERNLGVLGTLGNNAPFIGLFGTVLGIIKAFADLAHNQAGGAAAVMSGISEALVATAVGLMVAIPAVIAYNYFMGRVRSSLGRVDAMAHLILSAVAVPSVVVPSVIVPSVVVPSVVVPSSGEAGKGQ